jgi:hypothetical protein
MIGTITTTGTLTTGTRKTSEGLDHNTGMDLLIRTVVAAVNIATLTAGKIALLVVVLEVEGAILAWGVTPHTSLATSWNE